MKRIAALGMIAITIAANLNPMTADAAGVRSYTQCTGGTNATVVSGNCSVEDLQSKLADMGINSNCANLSINSNCANLSGSVNSQNCPLNGYTATPSSNQSESATDAKQQIVEAVKAQVANATANCATANCTTAACAAADCKADCTTADCVTANCNTGTCTTTNCNTSCTTSNDKVAADTNTTENNTTTDTNEVNTTPVSTTPVSTTPVSTTPVSTTPDSTTPVSTTPVNTETSNTTVDTQTTESSYAQQVVDLVNIERAKEGLSALTIDQNVVKAAMTRATEIQTKFAHVRPNGSGFVTALKENGVTYRGAGENIAWGQKTPEEVVTAWMNSPGHRANIMNANYVHIGVGNLQNSAGTQYWTQLFTY